MEKARIRDLFGIDLPGQEEIEVVEPSFETPDLDDSYQFNEDRLERLIKWWRGGFKIGLFVTGPTGCGKTTLFEQFLARLGADLVVVPCHGGLDMADLIGKTGIMKDGSTQFKYGAGVMAMRADRPTVLLLDELNFVPPNRTGLLNRIFDGKSFVIEETGEVVRPMPHFRLAATGNAVERGDDSPRYRGTQAMNAALLNRCRGLKLDYMSPLEEVVAINTAVPGVHPALLERLVEMANDIRASFSQGILEVVMSTRVLLDIADVLRERQDRVADNPIAEINWAMEYCMTDLARAEDRGVIADLVQRKMHGLNIKKAAKGPANPKANTAVPGTRGSVKTNAVMLVWINPERGPKGPTIWGHIVKNGQKYSFNGVILDGTVRDGVLRNDDWIDDNKSKKEAKGYQFVDEVEIVTADDPVLTTGDVYATILPIVEMLKSQLNNQVGAVPAHMHGFVQKAMRIMS